MYNNIFMEETLSQQDVKKRPYHDDNQHALSLDSSVNPYTSPTVIGLISQEEDEALRAKFEEDLSEILSNLTRKSSKNQIFDIYFTIGRFNPLHPGHIAMIYQMIDIAIHNSQQSENPFKIIIFAGSGPKNNDKTTEKDAVLNILNNPILFSQKKEIIEAILALKYDETFVKDNIEILEMGFVPQQLSVVMQASVDKEPSITIRSFRVAGDKDGGTDVIKSNYVEDYLKKFAGEKFNYIPDVLSIEAVNIGENPASATRVRVDALRMDQEAFIGTYLGQYMELFESDDDSVNQTIRDKLRDIIIPNIYRYIHLGIHERIINEILTNKDGLVILTDVSGDRLDDQRQAIEAYITKNINAYVTSEGKEVALANTPPIKPKPIKPKKAKQDPEAEAGGSRSKRRKTKRRKSKRRKSKKRRKRRN